MHSSSYAECSQLRVSFGDANPVEGGVIEQLVGSSDIATFLISKDPTYRISKLAAANQTVVSVKPDAVLAECVTKLMSHNFSQLPVMTNEREVKGAISWASIGSRLALSGNSPTHARHFTTHIMKSEPTRPFLRPFPSS